MLANFYLMDIKEQIELAKAGSEKAFTLIYNTYYKSIYNNIYNIVKNKDVSDDLISETFVKAFKNIDKFTKDISFEMWLKTIANNTSIDFIRRSEKLKDLVYSDDDQINEVIHTDYSNPESDYIKREMSKELRRNIDGLSNRAREILILRFVDERTYQEIADQLNISIGTVKHYIFKYSAVIKKNMLNQQKTKKSHENKSIVFSGNKVLS